MTLTTAGYNGLNQNNSQFKFTAYVASGTHTWDPHTKTIRLVYIGGGAGGASGRKGALGTGKTGGAGGKAGMMAYQNIAREFFGNTTSITIGAGGLGGPSQTANSTDGVVGGTGGQTYLDTADGFGSNTASGGIAGNATGAGSSNTNFVYSNTLSAFTLANFSLLTTNGQISLTYGRTGPTGGSGGGSENSSNVEVLPGAGTNVVSGVSAGAGTQIVPGGAAASYPTPAGNGQDYSTALISYGTGGGGGYAGMTRGDGGTGGNGGKGGGGGGGGGCSTDSVGNSGAGGNGGDGLVYIFEFFSKVY